jgi:hypothetical protein
MNYSKNLRRVEIAKRVVASWVIIAIVFSGVGVGVGYALKSHISRKQALKQDGQTSEQSADDFAVYGAYDDRIFTQETSLDWGTGDLDFTPLSVDMPDEQQEFLFYLCSAYNIDFSLTMALIQNESEYDPDAISPSDDYGLMQINKMNHEWLTETLGLTDFLDPYENLRAGCYILRKLFEKYQDTNMVLMCYNMGEEGAARLWSEGVYETNYTNSVLTIQQKFNEQLEGGQ